MQVYSLCCTTSPCPLSAHTAACPAAAGQGGKPSKAPWSTSPQQGMAAMQGMPLHMHGGYSLGPDHQAMAAAAAEVHQQSLLAAAAAGMTAAAGSPGSGPGMAAGPGSAAGKKKSSKRQRSEGDPPPPGPPGPDGPEEVPTGRGTRPSIKAVASMLPGTKAVAQSTNKALTSRFRGVCWNKKNRR